MRLRDSIKCEYKSTKNVLQRNGKILEILIYIKPVDILYRWFFCKRKRIELYDITISFGVYFIQTFIFA